MDKKQLWVRLQTYHFDNLVPPHLWDYISESFGGPDAPTKAFAMKIARKLKWSNKFALKAIAEYKKFVFLGVVSDFAVTPSKIIDQVWHEHLLFSKAYREFCSRTIEFNFDHNPELLPMIDQTGTFNAQYLDTINLYKAEFDTVPPADIWNIPKFDKEKVTTDGYESKKKHYNTAYNDNTPLYMHFDSVNSMDYSSATDYGGGSGGGGGATGLWDNSDSGSNAGSDSGSACSSSGCSSGCGGGD